MISILPMMNSFLAPLKKPHKKPISRLVQALYQVIFSWTISESAVASFANPPLNYLSRTKSLETLKEKIVFLGKTLTLLWALRTQVLLREE
jgi:hypothetical protein